MRAGLAIAAVLVLVGGPGAVAADPLPGGPPPPGASPHAAELAAHADEAPAVRPRLPATTLAALRAGAARRAAGPARVVYGYYPYWVAGLDTIRWSALTHLAWFAVELDATGAVTARHGWPDVATVEAAHAAGVKVDLAFTLFSGAGIRALTADPARRAAAITAMIDQLEAGGADGVAVDFEGLIDGTRANFTTFIAELRAGLDARGHRAAEISIAGPEVNWPGADGVPEFDLPALLDHASYYFVMGYGYFWSGSSVAGPIGILDVDATWRAATAWSMERTLAGFASEVGPAKRSQLIHGVPYYGREWVTASDQPAAAATSHVGAVTYSATVGALAGGRTRRWDATTSSPYYVWQAAGAWHQVWYDDVDSLDAKLRMIEDQDLGGVGIWALNYDAPHPELWDLLDARLGHEPPAPLGSRGQPAPLGPLPAHVEASTVDGPGRYFNRYGCAPATVEDGREWVYQVELCQPGRLTATVTDDAAADVDVHLLSALAEDACLARDDREVAVDLAAGTYYVVVDSFVANQVSREGAFALDVAFAPTPGTTCPVVTPPPSEDAGGCCAGAPASQAALAPLVLVVALRRRRRGRPTRAC
ncbi:MAG: glycosyl hydrolase family 18 protein [Kofleriaceae bacterium]